jgi:hypothetical protein
MKKILTVILLLAVVFGCGQEKPATTLAFKDVVKVKGYPIEAVLEKSTPVELHTVGIKNIHVLDSLLMVVKDSEKGFLSVYRLPGMDSLGSYILKGNGPGEQLFCPLFSGMTFFKNGNSLCVGMMDPRGTYMEYDVDRSIKEGKTVLVSQNQLQASQSLYCGRIAEGEYFYRTLSGDMRSQLRSVMKDTVVTRSKPMMYLNTLAVPSGSDGLLFNALSAITGLKPDRELVVEASTMMNTINVYSIKGTYAKTICLGSKPDDLEAICKSGSTAMKQKNFGLQVYDRCFAVLNSDGEKGSSKSVLFFDWKCNPLAKLTLSGDVFGFDVDWSSENLYTFDSATESIKKYDISSYKILR